MFNIVLYEPEIPPNTGNIIRLCANTGAQLHLIEPLGFALNDTKLRRAGLDYREWVSVKIYSSLEHFKNTASYQRLIAFSSKAQTLYSTITYSANDALLFGPETRGLPRAILDDMGSAQTARIPMQTHSRSLNLSNAVAIVLFEAWRQQHFNGAI